MASAPTRPVDVPPYQVQNLISNVVDAEGFGFDPSQVQVKCAQASGSEIYVGCTNGDLLRFGLVADRPSEPETYKLLSRQTLPAQKPIDEIVLVPCLARAFVLSDKTLWFYHLPTFEPVALTTLKPLRHVVAFAVDYYDLQRPPLSLEPGVGLKNTEPVNFSIIKRTSIAMYVMRERLSYTKEIPLPTGASHARRIGDTLLTADSENYNLISLSEVQLIPIIPLCQAPILDPTTGQPLLDKNGEWVKVKPIIEVVGVEEFLILSSTGAAGTMGLFITTGGDPVRGTLQWPEHPESLCLDYPYITALLPNDTIEIHNIDTQEIVQVISAPSLPSLPLSTAASKLLQPHAQAQLQKQKDKQQQQKPQRQRSALIPSLGGYHVPSAQRSGKMGMTKVKLFRGPGLRELEERRLLQVRGGSTELPPPEEKETTPTPPPPTPPAKEKQEVKEVEPEHEDESLREEREVERNLLLLDVSQAQIAHEHIEPHILKQDEQRQAVDLGEPPEASHAEPAIEQPPIAQDESTSVSLEQEPPALETVDHQSLLLPDVSQVQVDNSQLHEQGEPIYASDQRELQEVSSVESSPPLLIERGLPITQDEHLDRGHSPWEETHDDYFAKQQQEHRLQEFSVSPKHSYDDSDAIASIRGGATPSWADHEPRVSTPETTIQKDEDSSPVGEPVAAAEDVVEAHEHEVEGAKVEQYEEHEPEDAEDEEHEEEHEFRVEDVKHMKEVVEHGGEEERTESGGKSEDDADEDEDGEFVYGERDSGENSEDGDQDNEEEEFVYGDNAAGDSEEVDGDEDDDDEEFVYGEH